MTLIVINACYGGFQLSDEAYEYLGKLGVPIVRHFKTEAHVIYDTSLDDNYKPRDYMNRYWDSWTDSERDNDLLVQTVQVLGEAASGSCSQLKIIDIPDDISWTIEDYDGMETVAEQHRTWS